MQIKKTTIQHPDDARNTGHRHRVSHRHCQVGLPRRAGRGFTLSAWDRLKAIGYLAVVIPIVLVVWVIIELMGKHGNDNR